MATIDNFKDLKACQKASVLCQEVYELIQKEKFCREYKLNDQINGSSGSVVDNIAESF